MGETRLFFAADVHGSEKAFLKFLTAGRFYKANVIMLSGDITGKVVVPIVKQKDGTYSANFLGSAVVARTENELNELERNIRFNGQYPFLTNEDEKARLDREPEAVDQLFSDLMVASVRRWVQIAEKRLKDSGIKCFIMAGNDDRFEVDAILKESPMVQNPEEIVTNIDDHHEMISSGYSNMTPWNCPRDVTEEELAEKIDVMISRVHDMQNCIFNFHCPPYDSGLDTAPELDKTLKPTGMMNPVGSHAVREVIEKNQPLLSLHGHVHEAQGFCKIGRTLCLNPGSEYSEGILRGVVINLGEYKVKNFLFTRG